MTRTAKRMSAAALVFAIVLVAGAQTNDGWQFSIAPYGWAAGSDPSERHPSVLVRLGECWKLGFLVEELDSGQTVVFIPSAPRPWSGEVVIVKNERVTMLTRSSKAVVTCISRLGDGAGQLLKGKIEGSAS